MIFFFASFELLHWLFSNLLTFLIKALMSADLMNLDIFKFKLVNKKLIIFDMKY